MPEDINDQLPDWEKEANVRIRHQTTPPVSTSGAVIDLSLGYTVEPPRNFLKSQCPSYATHQVNQNLWGQDPARDYYFLQLLSKQLHEPLFQSHLFPHLYDNVEFCINVNNDASIYGALALSWVLRQMLFLLSPFSPSQQVHKVLLCITLLFSKAA